MLQRVIRSEVFLMKIEVWSDFICPFCYLGKRYLEEALTLFSYADYVTVEYKSYELSPDTCAHASRSIQDIIAEKHQMSLEHTHNMLNDLQQQARAVGLMYDFSDMSSVNTFDAHRLVKYATKRQKGHAMIERLLRAHLIEGISISARDSLIQLATDVGLNGRDVVQVLNTERYEAKVTCDQKEAEQIGVQHVPFYVFDEQYAVSGLQPANILVEVMENVWAELSAQRKQRIKNAIRAETTYCTGGNCQKSDTSDSELL